MDASTNEPKTLLSALKALVERDPDAPLLIDGGAGRTWTRRAFVDDAEHLAGTLAELGRLRGVGLLMANRPEYFLIDTAALMAGATPVSLYPTASAEQLRDLIAHADIDVLFVEYAKLPTVLAGLGQAARAPTIVVLDAPAAGVSTAIGPVIVAIELLLQEQVTPIRLAEAAARVQSDDLATIVYTSGSTGAPKGVRLSHANLMAAACDIGGRAGVGDGDAIISWLPHAHVAERACHYACAYRFGLVVTTCADVADLPRLLKVVEPHWFGAFPRFWEKLKMRAEAELARYRDSLGAEDAIRGSRIEKNGATSAEDDVLSVVRRRLGFARARALNTGSAPTPPEVREFFASLGLFIGDIYGASETSTAGTMALPGRGHDASAGAALPGMEVAIASDGEVLLRGAAVMSGYHKAPDATAEALSPDGWYRTGDLGALDADGALWITGRKKELIIGLGGHNMSPAYIEAILKGDGDVIAQICVVGDGRPYNTALVSLDPDLVWTLIDRDAGPDVSDLPTISRIETYVANRLALANTRLARVEQIKRFAIVPDPWPPGGALVTPTLKLRRAAISAHYGDLIERLYAPDLQPGCLQPFPARA
ncbi:AMP-dependent synthetase/ligase [Caulobacter segnis]|uniref:AMP-dependent synthetase/ligase n=1 Tax=Caulobacter segnis TaxID=88688 RepID=UPI001CBCEFA3|nr:AMP-binding protein [Caulobacter segnis]UAL10205.1 AMP-binding protein [Caulobacter segnis]